MFRNIVVAVVLALAACQGKEGPIGPPGPAAKNLVWVDSTGTQVTLDGFVDANGFVHHLDAANDMYPVNARTGHVTPDTILLAYDNAQCTGNQLLVAGYGFNDSARPYPLEVFAVPGLSGYWQRTPGSQPLAHQNVVAAVDPDGGGCDPNILTDFSVISVYDMSSVVAAAAPPSDWKGPLHLEYR